LLGCAPKADACWLLRAAAEEMEENEQLEYVIATIEVDPETLDKLDTKNSSREKDGSTIRMPSPQNIIAMQLWEVYVVVAILILQPHSSVIFAHVKALCEHNEPRHLCETVLKEHTTIGNVTDTSQDVSLYTFFDEYFSRKFQINFVKNSLLKYVLDTLDDPLCGKDRIPRVFYLAPFAQAMLLNSQYFEGQYDELIDGMRMVNLPVNDVLQDGEEEIGEAVAINWDNVKLYDDPNMCLKKHGGWAITKAARMLTPKDQLLMRLTGCTLEQLLAGKDVPDSPRAHEEIAESTDQKGFGKSKSRVDRARTSRKKSMKLASGAGTLNTQEGSSDSDDSSHPSDFEVDAEHKKVVPLGLTLCEAYLLLRSLWIGEEAFTRDWKGSVVGQQVTRACRDRFMLAAAVLADLYMREQVEVYHWTLNEGNIAVAYKLERKRGLSALDHFLDDYIPHVEDIFRDMRLPRSIGEGPIWASLEQRGVIDNHRPSWQSAYGCGYMRVDVWDLVRPDVLLDLKEGYLTAARVLYDKQFPDPLNEESNDQLMFVYLLQQLFDSSLEAMDGMARVMQARCPPFHKGELFPPVTMVHSAAVCLGLIDRAFRIANSQDTNLAQEAAEFNEAVMERLEERFFLSPKILDAFDADQSGELSMEEFVEGMRGIDVYKDFRRERVPDDVLKMIVSDLAERLFHEVDINMDGTLTMMELQAAFKRRRTQALAQREKRQWLRRGLKSAAVQMGINFNDAKDQTRAEAMKMRKDALMETRRKENRERNEWASEVDKVDLLDEDVDVDTNVATYDA